MITQNYTEISPAYGRDYKNRGEAEADFKSGKDFVMQSISTGEAGKYCSVEDFGPGTKVQIRYNQMRSVTVCTVPSRDGLEVHPSCTKPFKYGEKRV